MASTYSNCQRCSGLVKQIADDKFKPFCDNCTVVEDQPEVVEETTSKAKAPDYRIPRRAKATGVG